jgi:ketol-acid reductoisomerase
VSACDKGEAGLEQIRKNGFDPVDATEAVASADWVVLAVPDRVIKSVTEEIVPIMKSGAALVLLDPAAPYTGNVEKRKDCTYVVTHPCHPALFSRQRSVDAYHDYFGGSGAEQDIVIAFESGDENAMETAEEICRRMFAPVGRCFRISVEQMAMLEPATVEVSVGAAIQLMKDALDEAVSRGVPVEAARSFVLGHLKVISAVIFGETDFPLSDAAQAAVKIGFRHIVKPDWKKVFEPDEIRSAIGSMFAEA